VLARTASNPYTRPGRRCCGKTATPSTPASAWSPRFPRNRSAAGPAWELPRAERDVLGFRFRSGDRELSIAELLDETYTDGFLVLHQGRILAEHYFNDLAPDVPHLLMSVSKSVTSAVAGVLAGRGELDVSARVEEIVPELGGTSFAGAAFAAHLRLGGGRRRAA
jgi:CubicO group peptidase (beta-lactamase class C family)